MSHALLDPSGIRTTLKTNRPSARKRLGQRYRHPGTATQVDSAAFYCIFRRTSRRHLTCGARDSTFLGAHCITGLGHRATQPAPAAERSGSRSWSAKNRNVKCRLIVLLKYNKKLRNRPGWPPRGAYTAVLSVLGS